MATKKANYKFVCECREQHDDPTLNTDTIICEQWSWQSVGSFMAWLLTDEGGYKSVLVETISDEELAKYRQEQ